MIIENVASKGVKLVVFPEVDLGQGDGPTLHCFEKIGRLGGLICWENFMLLVRNAMYKKEIQLQCAPTLDKSPKWLLSVQCLQRKGTVVIGVC